jgi:hypothetical protein
MTLDLNNVKQPHPTWGTGLTGADGWAYATLNGGRIPGAPNNAPDCAGRDVNTIQFTNQVLFFKAGQLGPFIQNYHTLWCPKDVATRNTIATLKAAWLARSVKVTSYCWNGTIGGYCGPKGDGTKGLGPAPNGGITYKYSSFQANDWQMWEQDERNGFWFNDAGNNPDTQGECISLRHSGIANWYKFPSTMEAPRSASGGAVVGHFDGHADLTKWTKAYDLIHVTKAPNELRNGPGYGG